MSKEISFQEIISGKNNNFLIGSGASVPLYPTLSLGKNLPSLETFMSHSGLSETSKQLLYYCYYFKWISPMTQKQELDNNYKSVCDSYITFIKGLLGFLNREGNERPKRANIFTTNYDLLFEWAFDSIFEEMPLFFFNDGSRGLINKKISMENYYFNVTHSGFNDQYRREIPTINLFKMHGSVSWTKSNKGIYVDHSSQPLEKCLSISDGQTVVAKVERFFAELEQFDNENYVSGFNDLSEELFEKSERTKELEAFYEKYLQLPIINPNKWKFHETVFEQHYYQLIRAFSYELEREETTLIIFGFSFGDEHLLDIFRRSLLNPTLQVIVILYDLNARKHFDKLFKEYSNINYYPKDFELEDGEQLQGDFCYFNELLWGE